MDIWTNGTKVTNNFFLFQIMQEIVNMNRTDERKLRENDWKRVGSEKKKKKTFFVSSSREIPGDFHIPRKSFQKKASTLSFFGTKSTPIHGRAQTN